MAASPLCSTTTSLARSRHLWLRQAVSLVLLIAAWQLPRVSSGEPDRYAAVAHGVPDRLPSRPGTELSRHVDRIRLAWPVAGSVTSRFGRRGLWSWHQGVDIKAPRGAPIHSAAAGIVIFSGRQSSYGRVIKIEHPDGLTTIYAHNSANFVKVGDRVKWRSAHRRRRTHRTCHYQSPTFRGPSPRCGA